MSVNVRRRSRAADRCGPMQCLAFQFVGSHGSLADWRRSSRCLRSTHAMRVTVLDADRRDRARVFDAYAGPARYDGAWYEAAQYHRMRRGMVPRRGAACSLPTSRRVARWT